MELFLEYLLYILIFGLVTGGALILNYGAIVFRKKQLLALSNAKNSENSEHASLVEQTGEASLLAVPEKSEVATLFKSRYSEELILCLLLLISVLLPFIWGSKTFVIFDHSIIAHGAQRILHGQIPQKDFIVPTGPLAMYTQAVFYWIFGESLYAYLFHAVFFNFFMTLMIFSIVRQQGNLVFATCSALGVAVWSYGIHTHPWFDTTAFFWIISAWFVWETFLFPRQAKHLLSASFLCGCFCGLSFLGKMNIGGIGTLLLASLIVHRHFSQFWGPICAFFSGVLSLVMGYVFVLYLAGSTMIEDNLLLRPLFMGRFERFLVFDSWENFIYFPDILFPATFLLFLVTGWAKRKKIPAKHILDLLALLFILFFTHTTSRSVRTISFFFYPFLLGLYGARFFKWRSKMDQLIICFFILSFTVVGIYLALKPSYFGNQFQFDYAFQSKNLKPFWIDRHSGEMIDEITLYLEAQMGPEDSMLCLPPNFGILHLAVGRPSQNIFLWYDPGMTYFAEELGDEERLMQSLAQNPPTWMVLINRGQLPIFESYSAFGMGIPEIPPFIKKNYKVELQKLHYAILKYKN